MKRYASGADPRFAASVFVGLLLPLWLLPAWAGDSRWSAGGAFTVVATSFAPWLASPGNTSGVGAQAFVLRRIAPNLRAGIEAGYYDHGPSRITYATAADFIGPPPMLSGASFTSYRAALTGQIAPSWAFAPYAAAGIGFYDMTNHSSFRPDAQEQTWGIELGAGIRGQDDLLPWLEWRWHHGLSPMTILDGASVDYHTFGVGFSWN